MSISAPTPSATSLYNLDTEQNCLSVLLQFPDTFGDFHIISRTDFSEAYQVLWDIISKRLVLNPPGSVTPLLLAEEMRSIGASLKGGFDPYEVLNGLAIRFIQKSDAAGLARELKRYTVRRQLVEKLEATKRELVMTPGASFDQMTTLVEKSLSSIDTTYYKPKVAELFSTLEYNIEKRADNPVNPDEQLYQGPLPSINRTIGPLIFPAAFTCTIARTSTGKSAFSFFYCVHVAERYNLPLLWIDAGEMTLEQLQMRAVSCLSGGKVPLWMVRTGEWRKHSWMVKLIRGELWPRVKKLRMFYHNTAGMNPKEKVSFVRRFHYNQVSREEFLIVCEDYLKGVEALGRDRAEYQNVGYYVSDMKSLVTNELNAGYWSTLQSNRGGISKGKKVEEMQDNEGSASLSDRISWECTNMFFMRFKEPVELAKEMKLFGNVALKPTKVREGYGREYEKILLPIKLPNGSFTTDYFHISMTNFHYIDKGLHSEAMEVMGQGAVNLGNTSPPAGSPPPVQPI